MDPELYNKLREQLGMRRRSMTSGDPASWHDLINTARNPNSNGTAWPTWNPEQPTNVEPSAPKTTEEFEAMDIENMSKEDIAKHLRDVLVALEESEAAWTEEHAKRVEAEETVKKLREAGFTGGETVVESEDEEDPEEIDMFGFPSVTASRGGVKYTVTPAPTYGKEDDALEAIRQQITLMKKMKDNT